jgi:hypothetical protein
MPQPRDVSQPLADAAQPWTGALEAVTARLGARLARRNRVSAPPRLDGVSAARGRARTAGNAP